ncbi:MAG: GDP-mannose 4,6-dehydratase [Deltaproteobacteria bacterium]|nr:GDP-mannose 4,6-dehydratase [Deltaproteobacteria bacterium]
MNLFKNKKVLVTGGSGFIASHLCRNLLSEGAELCVLTKYKSPFDNIRLIDLWKNIHWIEADIRNSDSLKHIVELQPEIIYHFAAYNHVGDSFTHICESFDSNAKGTMNLLEAYENYERFIYISSSEVYGLQSQGKEFVESLTPFPISPYAIGKYSGELYARMKWHVHHKPIVVVRPFNAFGPFQSSRAIIPELILKCLKGEDVLTTQGIQTRDFNYILNLIDAFKKAAFNEKAVGEIINIGSGEDISISDLTKLIHKLSESSSKLKIGALPHRPTEIWMMKADNHKAADILSWKPSISLENGLLKTIQWFRESLDLFENESSPLLSLCQKASLL